MSSIPILRPSYSYDELDRVRAAIRSHWWGMGPLCERFERAFAERHGRRYCVTVNSATAGLHLATLVSGIGPGDQVIVPALTFASTALAVLYCGAEPVFADVRPDTLTLDWRDVDRLRTGRTVAAIPVDYAGHPAGPGPGGLALIQDASHAAGGAVYGDLVVYSFHPVKPLATGDGGAILTDDPDLADRLRRLRWCGIDRSTFERASGRSYSWDYDIPEMGFKYHWNDLQAAVGLGQLARLDEMAARRRAIADRYRAGLQGVELPVDHPDHIYHLFPIRVRAAIRDRLIDELAAAGIAAGVHYKPLTHFRLFSGTATPPVTEREWRRLVSLPIYPDLTDREVDRITATVNQFIGAIS